MKTLIVLLSTIKVISCNSQSEKSDDSVLRTERERILNEFNSESKIRSADSDTLLDLNYDGNNDYIINYYGQSGSGIKNKVRIYIYDKKKGEFVLDERLSDLSNPSFYLDKKMITEFYIGNGGGSGSKLEWIKEKWQVTKTFDVEHAEKTIWKTTNLLSGKIEYFELPFQLIPPAEILETNIQE